MSSTTLRVLAVTNMYPDEADPGYGAFVASQMAAVTRAGMQVHIEFVDGRRGSLEYVRGIGRVRRLTRTQSFDVIHAHYGTTGFVAAFQPIPFVVSFCGDDLLGTPTGTGGITVRSRVQRALSRYAARRASAIICKSAEMRAALPHPDDVARAHVIPNGVDLQLFRPGDRTSARDRLGIGATEVIVLFPHTPGVPRKRRDVALMGIEELRRRGVAARLLDVHGRPHATMPDYYRAADCLLMTSEQEGSPNVVKEALCCDTPVISVRVGDVEQWVSIAFGSRIVERSPGAIADAIESLVNTHVTADGTAVRDQLSAERIAGRLVDVYREAMRAGRR